MKKKTSAVALLGAAALAMVSLALAWKQETTIERIMDRKLDHAHNLLEALITEDFEALSESAEALAALSEEAGWFILQTPEYTEKSASFRRAVAGIASAARDRNLDEAALGYVQMTLECVGCHRYLRGTRRAGGEAFPSIMGHSAHP